MTRPIWFALTVLAIASLTWAVGWWMVPIAAAALTVVRRRDPAAPVLAGIAGIVAWGAILLLVARQAPAGSVADAVGHAMGLGPTGLTVATLAYGGLLAGSAATLARALTVPPTTRGSQG